MRPPVRFSGENGRLLVSVRGYANSSADYGLDWVSAFAELDVAYHGRFHGERELTLGLHELDRFEHDLAKLLDSLSGRAALEHPEQDLGLTITLDHGTGTIHALIQDPYGGPA